VARARRQLPLLERSVRDAPQEPFHRYNLGVALHQLGLHAEAETELRYAVKLAPPRTIWSASAYGALSRAVAAQGRTAEAVKLGKVATRRAPDWARGWCLLGEALADAGRLDEALGAYARGLECGDEAMLPGDAPDDTAWQVRRGMAKIHLVREENAAAADCLAGAVALNPMDSDLHALLARAHEATGQSGDARRHLERAVTVARGGSGSYLAFCDFFTKKAEEALMRGLVDNAESRVLLERIERLRAARATP